MMVVRDAAGGRSGTVPERLDLDMEVDRGLRHLSDHDPDGFLTALRKDETLGFVASHVRSRQWVLSELWVLAQHRGSGAGGALLQRAIAYGESSGAREFLAIAPCEPDLEALLLRAGLRPGGRVYSVEVGRDDAAALGSALS